MGAKPELKDFGRQVLSLNSEFATEMVWFNLSTDLLSGRSLSACTGAQGRCWDAKSRVGRK